MKKKILTSVLLIGLMASGISILAPASYAAQKLTRKQKKENQYLETALSAFEMKQYDTAIEYYTKAIELNPTNSESYAKRANAKYLLGNYKDAVKDYTSALEIDPNQENIYYNRGIANTNLKAYDEVIADYTKELEVNPKNINAYLNRGTTKVKIGRASCRERV